VAYPWRERDRQYEKEGDPTLSLRVIIPEPSFWDPESPFLYEGMIELWQNKERCDQALFRQGLCTIDLGKAGLRWNGRPIRVCGVARTSCSEEEALRLHQAGCNTILASVGPDSSSLWELADQFGFLMFGLVESRPQAARARELSRHPSCAGWICGAALVGDPASVFIHCLVNEINQQLIGWEITNKEVSGNLGEFHLELRDEQALPHPGENARPVLVRRRTEFMSLSKEEMEKESAGTLGSIYL